MPEKNYALRPDQVQALLPDGGNAGCIASDRITVDGRPVGYMYRDRSDGLWNFFAGDEDDAYADEAANFDVYALNTIANYDRTIIPFLGAPAGSAWFRSSDTFQADPDGAPTDDGE